MMRKGAKQLSTFILDINAYAKQLNIVWYSVFKTTSINRIGNCEWNSQIENVHDFMCKMSLTLSHTQTQCKQSESNGFQDYMN